eukprot:11046691-Alexandrium_andersonii.AAC.1
MPPSTASCPLPRGAGRLHGARGARGCRGWLWRARHGPARRAGWRQARCRGCRGGWAAGGGGEAAA